MIKTKAIRKIFVTTLTLFILLTAYSIPNTNNEKVLRTNMEIKENNLDLTTNIYLLNEDNFLVQTKIILDTSDKIEQIKKIIESLRIKEEKDNNNLSGVIHKNVKVNNILYKDKIITIDFSKELQENKYSRVLIESLVYSIMELDDIKGLILSVDGLILENYNSLPTVLNKEIGINIKYELTKLSDIEKVVMYYISELNDKLYYVPVTRYLNDDREKITIIVEQLSSSYIYEDNLMSFLNSNIKLLDFEEKENILFLNFNDYLFSKDNKVVEEVIYAISYSVFANYDVSSVYFEVNNEIVKQVFKEDL